MVLIIFKNIATSGFLTALECTKFVFGRANPTGGAYSAPPGHLAGLRGPTYKGERKVESLREERKTGKGRGREGEGPPFANSWILSC